VTREQNTRWYRAWLSALAMEPKHPADVRRFIRRKRIEERAYIAMRRIRPYKK
jgi:hypothetical protein